MLSNILNKIKALPAGVKASVAFFFASVITSGISYIVTPIYTRLLTEAEYGKVSVFMTWQHLFGIVAMFCLSYGVFNNGMLDHKDKRDEFSFSMLMLSNLITLVFSVILLSLYPIIRHYLDIDLPFVILMCALYLFQPAYNFWVTRQRYELKYKWVVLWTVVCAIASPITAVICILSSDNRLYARIFGADVALITIYIFFYIYLAVKSKFKVNISFWKAAFLFNLPLIPHYLSTYLLTNSNKLMISWFAGDESAAYYSVAQAVAMIASIVWSAINSSLIPFTYENCARKNYKAISNITMPILAMFAVVCIGVTMLAPEVVTVMATKNYMEAIYVIPPIACGLFFQVQYYIYANIIYFYKKPKYVMFASVTTVFVNFVVNFFLIRKFGYLAAGYTTLICYLLQATLDYLAMKKVVKERVYNMRYIGSLSFAVVAVALLSNLLYKSWIIRYSIILVMIVLCFLFRKKIIEAIKNIKGNK